MLMSMILCLPNSNDSLLIPTQTKRSHPTTITTILTSCQSLFLPLWDRHMSHIICSRNLFLRRSTSVTILSMFMTVVVLKVMPIFFLLIVIMTMIVIMSTLVTMFVIMFFMVMFFMIMVFMIMLFMIE